MNLLLFSLSFFLPLRDPLDYSCQVYSGLFFACYTVSVTFSGFILMIKAYYASSMSRLLLFTLIILHLLSIATNIYATVMVYIAYNPSTTLCITDIHIPSFILSIATEFAFNLLVTAVFLVYIFQANRQFQSSLYRILFIDGMVAWISIAFFRGLLIFTFNKGFNDMAAILIAISVLVTSCIITWQLRHSRMKGRL
ncbi:hypothetical protein IWQ60_008778 [Tieghemiomyces parasiticus]|uniref:Uncharacterized protein n=1 Tax=Tieghemiomyces parasiticus TaxID=78921 RepID=A0A9W7ZRI4_9FUNG|nr:hypothetical protein IWQ60_008778 [Tieghemiomyces parasiticus]